ncbi:MAG: hypothetical protein CMB80_02895 [Flammeovirgaceae bacterium]|nr:hypothetical protein [Flammeovirgaceae bacterium]
MLKKQSINRQDSNERIKIHKESTAIKILSFSAIHVLLDILAKWDLISFNDSWILSNTLDCLSSAISMA